MSHHRAGSLDSGDGSTAVAARAAVRNVTAVDAAASAEAAAAAGQLQPVLAPEPGEEAADDLAEAAAATKAAIDFPGSKSSKMAMPPAPLADALNGDSSGDEANEAAKAAANTAPVIMFRAVSQQR